MAAYYNEVDSYAAQWLRNLIAAGHIAPGDVDERDIRSVRADDLKKYDQCHFFAGIGGWSLALRLAGWPDDRPVWTGSCPCQPFSAAGAGKAADDERHLWPAWLPLIAECRPATIFGEQVEAAIGWGWLDAVLADLEAEGYACGATVLPACSVGAPHIRQRLWFVAHANDKPRRGQHEQHGGSREGARQESGRDSQDGVLADNISEGRDRIETARLHERRARTGGDEPSQSGADGAFRHDANGCGEHGLVVADATSGGLGEQRDASQPRRGGHADGGVIAGELGDTRCAGSRRDGGTVPRSQAEGQGERSRVGDVADELVASSAVGELGHADCEREVQIGGVCQGSSTERGGIGAANFWSDAEWIACTDGKDRPIGPGSFPLAHGVQRRPSKLRAYGNAIVPQVAAEFIAASYN